MQEPPVTPASGVTSTEEGRAFFQDRLSLFGKCAFLLSAGFYVALNAAYLAVYADLDVLRSEGPQSLSALLHLGATAVAALLWLGTRRGALPARALTHIDAIATFAISSLLAASGAAQGVAASGVYVTTLTVVCVVVTRAIIVPSTAVRTAVVSLECAVPVPILAALAFGREGVGGAELVVAVVNTGLWGGVAVTIATVASRIIFGLRRQAGRARVLGQYTLEEKIGEGGMGEVWRARHAMLRRPTAVKLLPPERAGEAAIRRFEREVQHTAKLTHPNTVAIFDFGRTAAGVFYYAMELLDGLDLDRLVALDGPQPPERVVHILEQVCGALAEAHDAGLVHRDVKPANILLVERRGEADVAKVVDFGLVKDLDTTAAEPAVTGSSVLTGTPLYLSPESVRAPETIDGRSDLYAVGAVGWFLLAGRPPFEARSVVEVCGHHLHTAPDRPSTRLGRALPADLEDVLLACLEKDPARRPADARTLRRSLAACACAKGWTAERAAAWWSAIRPRLAVPHEPAPAGRTVAIDLGRRVPG